jgi:hypothetical protein
MVNNSSNINKPKERSLLKLSFGLLILEELLTITVQTFFWFVDIGGIVDHLCLIRWSTILPISTNQKKVLTVMVNNSTNINKTKESLNLVLEELLTITV